MFKRKKPHLVKNVDDEVDQPLINDQLLKELAGRLASLFMICYRRRDISGIHIAFTSFTHMLHALKVWDSKDVIMADTKAYILHEGFPVAEIKALEWLLNHYFEQKNEVEEEALLNWYQSLDDEWVLRNKLREMFPDKENSELTLLIAEEQKNQQHKPESQQ